MKVERKYALVQLPADVHKIIKSHCKDKGMNMSGYLVNLIRKDLKLKDDLHNQIR